MIERSIIQWIYDRPLETLLATWGVGIVLQVVVKLIFGSELYYVGAPKVLDGGFRVIGLLPFPYYRMFLIVLAALMMAATFYLIFKTDFGLKVRAVRRNRAIAGCLGIDTAKVDMMIFTFGAGLAGIAGAALAPIKSVSPPMGFRTRSTTWSWSSGGSAVCGASWPAQRSSGGRKPFYHFCITM